MKKILATIVLFLSQTASAGDEMKSGTILTEDSYVFSIDEAEKLKVRIQYLEKKEKLLDQYTILENLKDQQNTLLKASIDLKDGQINLYKKIIIEKDNQIDLIQKRKNKQFLNGAAIFGAGILFTSISIYAADKLDDSISK